MLPRCIARLTPKASDLIQTFVETGVAFSVGASIPALRDKAQESLLLAFYDDTTRDHVHLTFRTSSNDDRPSRTPAIRAPDGDLIDNISDSGSLSLIGFDASQKNLRVLDSYADETLAGVKCTHRTRKHHPMGPIPRALFMDIYPIKGLFRDVHTYSYPRRNRPKKQRDEGLLSSPAQYGVAEQCCARCVAVPDRGRHD